MKKSKKIPRKSLGRLTFSRGWEEAWNSWQTSVLAHNRGISREDARRAMFDEFLDYKGSEMRRNLK